MTDDRSIFPEIKIDLPPIHIDLPEIEIELPEIDFPLVAVDKEKDLERSQGNG